MPQACFLEVFKEFEGPGMSTLLGEFVHFVNTLPPVMCPGTLPWRRPGAQTPEASLSLYFSTSPTFSQLSS